MLAFRELKYSRKFLDSINEATLSKFADITVCLVTLADYSFKVLEIFIDFRPVILSPFHLLKSKIYVNGYIYHASLRM